MAKKLTRILSIDGGGIRGILPGQILVLVEEKLRQKTGKHDAKIGEYFDLVAGTSTGGILACAYLCPSEYDAKKPKFSAQDAVDLYLEHGGDIFSISTWHKIRTAGGLLDERFPQAAIESVLKKYFGDTQLKELIKPCLISAYDVEQGKPFFFKQHKAKKDKHRNYYVWQAARATSAAPTYFEAAEVTSMAGTKEPLIDGGVFVNNPALCAYAEARELDFGKGKVTPNASEMLIFSLGTGGTDKSYRYEKVKNFGIVQWIKPLIDIMMKGVAQTVDYQLEQIYDAVHRSSQYIRIDPSLAGAKSDMDDASESNLNDLRRAGIASASEHSKEIDRLVDMLIENHHE